MCLQTFLHTRTRASEVSLPAGILLEGVTTRDLLELPLRFTAFRHTPPEGVTTRVALELPLALVWPSRWGETAWHYAGRPASLLKSPGQVRQTFTADRLVVR